MIIGNDDDNWQEKGEGEEDNRKFREKGVEKDDKYGASDLMMNFLYISKIWDIDLIKYL